MLRNVFSGVTSYLTVGFLLGCAALVAAGPGEQFDPYDAILVPEIRSERPRTHVSVMDAEDRGESIPFEIGRRCRVMARVKDSVIRDVYEVDINGRIYWVNGMSLKRLD